MITLLAIVLAQAEPTKESAEAAIRALYKGMASDKAADQVKALQAVLATKEDMEALLGAHAAKIWPRMDEGQADMVKNIDKVAAEMTRRGALQTVELKAVTKPSLLDLLPKGTPVFDYVNRYETGSSGGGSYVWVRSRWLFIRGLSSLPEMLEKLK